MACSSLLAFSMGIEKTNMRKMNIAEAAVYFFCRDRNVFSPKISDSI
ncbi:hypothetical protein AB434_0520 [Heyndrickxia coagulans]|uniref:Uncharacterized protein n=1 Tax=Heyndrickxia coagulans TaxID=1398 RepID=A0AAN0WAT9_HEYCO|nr:hypothetical protein SB48_HM08orf01004 [Heyndrickxia coagulans]AKN52925.1 hypothetical protein AB434_0520 [Heyndrickxia coagulans]